MAALHRNFIAGAWTEGATATRNLNPSNVDDVVGDYAQADSGQTEDAIVVASAALPRWPRTSPQERRDVLAPVSAEILAGREHGPLLAREEGKTPPAAVGEAARAGQTFDVFAGEGRYPAEFFTAVKTAYTQA